MPEEWVQCILVFAKIMYLLQFKCNSRKYHLISLTSLNGNLHFIQKKCFTPISDQQYLGSPNLTEVTINSIHSSGLWIFSKSLNKPSSDASAFSSYTHQWSLPAATATPVHTSPHHLSHCSGITSVLSSTLCCWFPARLLLLQLFQATASIRVAESVLFHHVGCSDLHWRLQKAKVQHAESKSAAYRKHSDCHCNKPWHSNG